MLVIALLVAVAAALPQYQEPIRILKQSQEQDTENGEYSFRSVPLILSGDWDPSWYILEGDAW